jgi:hypothetical protein
MSQTQSQAIPQATFLRMSANLLHKAFHEATRTEAKNLYKELSAGRVMPLTQVQMEDKSLVRFDISLDQSEFRGALNFGAFKASLQVLIVNLAKALEEEQEITVFTADNNPEARMFGVTGVTYEQEQANVLVLGADSGSSQAVVKLSLMYLDPAQFAAPEGQEQA